MMWEPTLQEQFAVGDREATELAGKKELLFKRLNQATPDGESSTRRKSRQPIGEEEVWLAKEIFEPSITLGETVAAGH